MADARSYEIGATLHAFSFCRYFWLIRLLEGIVILLYILPVLISVSTKINKRIFNRHTVHAEIIAP
jgi:hypothetical protein